MKSQDAYVGSHWIELRRSRIAQKLKLIFYVLILASILTWSTPLVWKALAYLFVITCYVLDCLYDRARSKIIGVDTVVLSNDRGVVATRRGGRVCKVQSFKIEHILCYYIQIHLCYENGEYQRLYIFPDSMDEKAFHKFRCVGVRYKGRG